MGWLVPAFVDHRFVYAMVAWDVLLLLAWAADLSSLPRPGKIRIRRTWLAPLSLSVTSQAKVAASNGSQVNFAHSRSGCAATVAANRASTTGSDRTPGRRNGGRVFPAATKARETLPLPQFIFVTRAGFASRSAGPWLIWRRNLPFIPNLEEAKRHALYLVRSRQVALEKRFSRVRGAGRAFESLREYQDGDDFGDICWSATRAPRQARDPTL